MSNDHYESRISDLE